MKFDSKIKIIVLMLLNITDGYFKILNDMNNV